MFATLTKRFLSRKPDHQRAAQLAQALRTGADIARPLGIEEGSEATDADDATEASEAMEGVVTPARLVDILPKTGEDSGQESEASNLVKPKSDTILHNVKTGKVGKATPKTPSAARVKGQNGNSHTSNRRKSKWDGVERDGSDASSEIWNKPAFSEKKPKPGSMVTPTSIHRRVLKVGRLSDEGHRVGRVSKVEARKLVEELDKNEDEGRMQREALVKGTVGWTDDEVSLFNVLNNRGFEPLLLDTWRIDFPTLPEEVFTADDDQTFINSNHQSDFRAKKCLTDLFGLGVLVRGRVDANRSPESTLIKAIDTTLKWALRDADMLHRDYIPIYTVASMQPNEELEATMRRVTAEMHGFGCCYREAWEALPPPNDERTGSAKDKRRATVEVEEAGAQPRREPPTIYGLLVVATTVSVLTYDSMVPGKRIRVLANFDFSQEMQDVWNGLAISVVVIWMRNVLMSLNAPLGPREALILDPDL